MGNYHYGIREGNRLRVSLAKNGVSEKGFKWSNFKCIKSSKNKETGRYQKEALYEIWIGNGIIVKDGDIVKIERIISTELKYYIKNNVKEYYVMIWANIELISGAEELIDNSNFDLEEDTTNFSVDDGIDNLFD